MGLFAHQGGWDEILLILGPMAVVVLLLRLAKQRVERNLANSQQVGLDQPADTSHSAPPAPPAP